MRPPFPHPERVPASAAARLGKNLAELIAALDTVLGALEPNDPSKPRLHRAATLLRQEEAYLQHDVNAFSRGDREPLLTRAADLRLLARRMNGYAASDAETMSTVLEKRQLLVLTSWQIAAMASGSEAAGL